MNGFKNEGLRDMEANRDVDERGETEKSQTDKWLEMATETDDTRVVHSRRRRWAWVNGGRGGWFRGMWTAADGWQDGKEVEG